MDRAEDRQLGNLVYHYTTPEGLKGIIENRCIWATNVNYLNDASEYKHGVDVIKRGTREFDLQLEALIPKSVELTAFKRDILKTVTAGMTEHLLEERDHSLSTFVASFFEAPDESDAGAKDGGDVLEQWRGYNHGSSGVSIGFDKSLLDRRVSGSEMEHPGSITVSSSCTYDLKEKTFEVRRIVESLAPTFPSLIEGHTIIQLKLREIRRALVQEGFLGQPASLEGAVWQSAWESATDSYHSTNEWEEFLRQLERVFPLFSGLLAATPAFMKDPAFAAEREWRIARFCFKGPSQTLFRVAKSGLVPYVEIKISDPANDCILANGLIKRIVVGPLGLSSGRERDNAVAAIKILLEKNHLAQMGQGNPCGVIVEPSRLPLRER